MRYRRELKIVIGVAAVLILAGLMIEYSGLGQWFNHQPGGHEPGGDVPEQPSLDDLN